MRRRGRRRGKGGEIGGIRNGERIRVFSKYSIKPSVPSATSGLVKSHLRALRFFQTEEAVKSVRLTVPLALAHRKELVYYRQSILLRLNRNRFCGFVVVRPWDACGGRSVFVEGM